MSIAQLLLRCGDRFRVEPRPPLSLAGSGPREAAYVLDKHTLETGAGRLFFSEYQAGGPDSMEPAAATVDRNDTVDGVWGAAGVVGVITAGAHGTMAGGADGGAGDKGGEAAGETCEVVFGDPRYGPRVEEGLALLSQVPPTALGATGRARRAGVVRFQPTEGGEGGLGVSGPACGADAGAGYHARQRGLLQLAPRRHGPRRRAPHPRLRRARRPPPRASRLPLPPPPLNPTRLHTPRFTA